MKLSDLEFSYPQELIAQHPVQPSRIMQVTAKGPEEISKAQLLEQVQSGDVFVVNNTKVEKRRVYGRSESGVELEILFVEPFSDPLEATRSRWKVLFPASRLKKNDKVKLPLGYELALRQRGIPQIVEVSHELSAQYFAEYGELPLPPYIQKARGERHERRDDASWYQSKWAKVSGSQAAPTASFHFNQEDLQNLKDKGVHVCEVTLHVGLGTFLQVKVEDLVDHKMHSEQVEVARQVWKTVQQQRAKGHRLWALGTTVVRSLEACARGHLKEQAQAFVGTTDLLLQPGSQFHVVDVLLTNFHQPRSTLLALVCGFYGRDRVLESYQWAVKNKFRLFSYGDLTLWLK